MLSPDDITNQQKLLAVYRRNLVVVLHQVAQYGGEQSAPLDKINTIVDARNNIQQIKDTLRLYDVQVDDKPNDFAPARQALDKAISKQSPLVTETERTRVLRRASFTAEVLRGAQVLWVDDHSSNNLNERQILRAYNIFVDLARSTEEAIDMLHETHYDLIISDMGRQEIKDEGLRLLDMIQQDKHPRPLIFYTMYAPEMWKKARTAFAITNRPDQLLHYIIDVLERERI